MVRISTSPSCTPTLRKILSGWITPGDRHAEFNFFIDNAVAADDHRAAFFDFIGAAFEDLTQDLDIHFALGEADDVHAGLGLAAHGVNIAQRVGRRDLPEDIGVIDDRREKIDRVDDRKVGAQSIHPRVVGGFGADEHVGIFELGQLVQNLREVGGAELCGSTRGFDLLRQAHSFFFFSIMMRLL